MSHGLHWMYSAAPGAQQQQPSRPVPLYYTRPSLIGPVLQTTCSAGFIHAEIFHILHPFATVKKQDGRADRRVHREVQGTS